MLTIGIDVASQAIGTAACWVRWEHGEARIEKVEHRLEDDRLLEVLSERADTIGVDVPLGWPDDFVAAVSAHHAGRPFGDTESASLTRRATDSWVWANLLQMPLSVSTDRIAYPAMRMARLLGQLNEPVDRAGTGKIVEVYPAAALRVWKLQHQRYKRSKNRDVLAAILAEMRPRCPWLSAVDATWREVVRTDHAFDALICALVARAHALGRCHPIPRAMREAAGREGWIAVPVEGSLQRLTQGSLSGVTRLG